MEKIANLIKIANDLDDIGFASKAEQIDQVLKELIEQRKREIEPNQINIDLNQINMNDGKFSFWIISDDFNKKRVVFRLRSDRGNDTESAIMRAKEKGILSYFDSDNVSAMPANTIEIDAWFRSHPGFYKKAQIPAKQPQIQEEPIKQDLKEKEAKKEFKQDQNKSKQKGIVKGQDYVLNRRNKNE